MTFQSMCCIFGKISHFPWVTSLGQAEFHNKLEIRFITGRCYNFSEGNRGTKKGRLDEFARETEAV